MNANKSFPQEKISALRILAGTLDIKICPAAVFDDNRIEFLSELGKALRKDPETAAYTEVAAFAFWCRKANLQRLKETQDKKRIALGKGLVFHIAPSNVPVNFAYSYVLGLLAGNSNIVRVSSKEFPQVELICKVMRKLFAEEAFSQIAGETLIVSYDHDQEITDYFSGICDARVIWGGDETIQTIRKSPMKVRSTEIAFADRYSLGLIRPSAILQMDEEALRQLAENFYNDTYLMDQNACSAPHLILWLTDSDEEKEMAPKAKACFWNQIAKTAQKYDLAPIKVSSKYDALCNFLADWNETPPHILRYDNLLYTAELCELPDKIDTLRGTFGFFFSCEIASLDELADKIDQKVQTAALCGVSKEEMLQFICRNHLQGIDRLTAFGETLDMGLIWDGYDIIATLSRIIGA